jgi:hypothetical protein
LAGEDFVAAGLVVFLLLSDFLVVAMAAFLDSNLNFNLRHWYCK